MTVHMKTYFLFGKNNLKKLTTKTNYVAPSDFIVMINNENKYCVDKKFQQRLRQPL